jgi:spore coat protein A
VPLGPAQATRKLLMWNNADQYGRRMPQLGTIDEGGMAFHMPVTEQPTLGQTEVWEVYNNTGMAHPVHLHLVGFQVLGRQRFTASSDPVTGALSNIQFSGAWTDPPLNERGWKDTVQVGPREMVRVIARFDRAGSYVWHCHILSHEDHEMMRPFRVVTSDRPINTLRPLKPRGTIGQTDGAGTFAHRTSGLLDDDAAQSLEALVAGT